MVGIAPHKRNSIAIPAASHVYVGLCAYFIIHDPGNKRSQPWLGYMSSYVEASSPVNGEALSRRMCVKKFSIPGCYTCNGEGRS